MTGVFTIDGEECIPITEYARFIGRAVTTVRHLIMDGNGVRKMRAIRVGNRYYIPLVEVYGFPHVNSGRRDFGDPIYHFDKNGERYKCEKCTFNAGRALHNVADCYCEARQRAEQLIKEN